MDGALSKLLADARSAPPAGLADRVFAASREHLPKGASELLDDGVLAHISSVSDAVAERRRIVQPRGGRWIRVALASAAMIAVAAGAILAYQRSQPEPRGGTQIADGTNPNTTPNPSPNPALNPALVAESNGDRTMLVNDGMSRASAAELTLVAFHNPNASRIWLSEESLGGSDAAALAAPVLRTHGAELDDIEGELGEILGLSFANAPGTPSPAKSEAGSF